MAWMPKGQTEKILGTIIVDGNIMQLVRIFAPYGLLPPAHRISARNPGRPKKIAYGRKPAIRCPVSPYPRL
jgi:hypothetical protein